MRTLLTLSIIMTFLNFSWGKDTIQTKYRITTIPTQFIFFDFPLTVEKVFNRQTIGLTLSYRPSTQRSGEINGGAGIFGYYLEQNFRNHLYNAYTIAVSSKYFLKRKFIFLEVNIFYRNWWFANKNSVYDNVEGYRFSATRSETQSVYGLKMLFGRMFKLQTKGKVKPIIELYFGIGLRYKTYIFETYNGTIFDVHYTYKRESGSNLSDKNRVTIGIPFSIQGGVKVGLEK